MQRLSQSILDTIKSAESPQYDRAAVHPGILHLGIGGFHRAHQAVYADDLLAKGHMGWGIVGVSFHSPTMRDRLNPQDGLYTLGIKRPSHTEYRIIGSVLDVLCLTDQRDSILAVATQPELKLLTLTITEKGYCATPDGHLDQDHPDIQHDLDPAESMTTAPGLIVKILEARAHAGMPPLTVLSCDNLSNNGTTLRTVVGELADIHSPKLDIDAQAAFANTMVDRIVPASQEADLASHQHDCGFVDAAYLNTEPFSQWIIEDKFVATKPPLEEVGVQIVDSVGPYENAKLRLLNASHSLLAYFGLLKGYAYIHEAIADPRLLKLVTRYTTSEVLPNTTLPPGFNADTYINSIIKRFANSSVPYRTAQVAADGSQKLPQRIRPIIDAAPAHTPIATAVIAAYLACWRNPEIRQTINDPGGSDYVERLAWSEDPVAVQINDYAEQLSTSCDAVIDTLS